MKTAHPEFGIRALKHAIALGSESARKHLSVDNYDDYFPDENLKASIEMDLT